VTIDTTAQEPPGIGSDAGSERGSPAPDTEPQVAAYERRVRRVRLLIEKVDRLETDATARTGGVANKAPFLAVATVRRSEGGLPR
jgi:hypothetical protein